MANATPVSRPAANWNPAQPPTNTTTAIPITMPHRVNVTIALVPVLGVPKTCATWTYALLPCAMPSARLSETYVHIYVRAQPLWLTALTCKNSRSMSQQAAQFTAASESAQRLGQCP